MAVTLLLPLPDAYAGLSGDAKPTASVVPGSTFVEFDTGRSFVWDGAVWRENAALAQTLNGLRIIDESLDARREANRQLRAIRIGIQELLNAGNPDQDDLLELADTLTDEE